MVGKVRIKFRIEVIDNACLVARAVHLMTHGEFAEGYSLIRDMQGSDFLTALRMLAEQEAVVKKQPMRSGGRQRTLSFRASTVGPTRLPTSAGRKARWWFSSVITVPT